MAKKPDVVAAPLNRAERRTTVKRFVPGERIYRQRIALGWTRRELAEQAEVSVEDIDDVEKGRRPVAFGELVVYARALGIKLDRLLDPVDRWRTDGWRATP